MLVLSVAITDKYYLLISLLFLVATMVPLYRRFENKKFNHVKLFLLLYLQLLLRPAVYHLR